VTRGQDQPPANIPLCFAAHKINPNDFRSRKNFPAGRSRRLGSSIYDLRAFRAEVILPPSDAPRLWLHVEHIGRRFASVLDPPSARGVMWSAVQFSRVSVTPQPGHGVPMAWATSLSRVLRYSLPYAARCCSVFGAHRVRTRRGRGFVVC
jgi:hypothetical protein